MYLRFALPILPMLLSAAPAPAGGFAVVARYPIEGSGTYDYIRFDPGGRRLFVAHDRRFEVIDADSGRKLGEIGGVSRAHGVALVPDLNRGFATSGNTNAIVMFDLKTLGTLAVIRSTGRNPDSIEYDDDTRRVYAVNGASGNVSVIDPAAGAVVATVELVKGKLEQIGFDGRGRAYVNNEEKSAVHVFDTHTLKVLGTWPLAPGEGGTGLAVDREHHRVLSACGNEKLVVLDSDTGAVVATPAIGEDPDGVVFDPIREFVFTSNVEGTLSIVHQDSPDAYSAVQTVPTVAGARTLAYDAKSGRVFLVAARFGPVPAATPENPHPRAPVLPGTFELLVVSR
jgi:YVTN family beta-propeller protein